MLNGFSIGTGIMIDSNTLQDNFVAIKLKEEDLLTIGYIKKEKMEYSMNTALYKLQLKLQMEKI